jgi:hypothetical protein
MGKGSTCRLLGSAVLLGALVLAGCGGGGKSGSPTAASSTQTLKRVDVHVTRGGSAEAPRSSMLAMIGNLLGWPQTAEADTGVQGCTVTAQTGGASAVTDAAGNAILTTVPFPNNIFVACPTGPSGGPFAVTGTAGAVVKVEVEVGSIEVKVKDQHVSAPKVSQPSTPSKPTDTNHHGEEDD